MFKSIYLSTRFTRSQCPTTLTPEIVQDTYNTFRIPSTHLHPTHIRLTAQFIWTSTSSGSKTQTPKSPGVAEIIQTSEEHSAPVRNPAGPRRSAVAASRGHCFPVGGKRSAAPWNRSRAYRKHERPGSPFVRLSKSKIMV